VAEIRRIIRETVPDVTEEFVPRFIAGNPPFVA
jgi:hypothetical protein